MIMFTCSATCSTFSIPVRRVFDLLPRSNHDSMPGSMRLEPVGAQPLEVRLGRAATGCSRRCAACGRGGTAASIGLHVVVEAHAEVGIVPADDRLLHLGEQEREVRRSAARSRAAGSPPSSRCRSCRCRGSPRLPIIGTILMVGALASVASTNFQRAASAGSSSGWRSAADLPAQRAGAARTPRSTSCTTRAVGEAEHVVEVLPGVLGVAAGVGPAEHREAPR